MEHRFYAKSEAEQRWILITICALTFFIVALIIGAAFVFRLPLLIFLIPLTLSLAAPFIDTPSGRKSGKLIYYSPLFIAERPHRGVINLHGGTLFDYVYTLNSEMSGALRTRLILLFYVRGLIALLDDCEVKAETGLKVRGTSYIINERTAERIGLKKVPTSPVQTVILVLNYLQLSVAYSRARARISFPRLTQVATFEASIPELIARRDVLLRLEKRLAGGIRGHD